MLKGSRPLGGELGGDRIRWPEQTRGGVEAVSELRNQTANHQGSGTGQGKGRGVTPWGSPVRAGTEEGQGQLAGRLEAEAGLQREGTSPGMAKRQVGERRE